MRGAVCCCDVDEATDWRLRCVLDCREQSCAEAQGRETFVGCEEATSHASLWFDVEVAFGLDSISAAALDWPLLETDNCL